MAWYPDLSEYEYLGASMPMLNVGWLERGHDFDTGPVPRKFTARLRAMSKRPQDLCRGTHVCDLCARPDDTRLVDWASARRFFSWGKSREGNGEIHVRSATGTVYSAPLLVVHYVTAHGYRPPQVFVDAVLSSD